MPRPIQKVTADEDWVPIGEAARMLRRSVETLRKWSQRRPPRLAAERDGITKTRFFRRKDVERLMLPEVST